MQNLEETKTMISRYRSPVFTNVEIKALLDVIDKYKRIIMNRSISGNACRAKEVAWANITKIFNNQGFDNQRNTEQLRMKWENLKKVARKVYKNILENGDHNGECDDIISQVVAMISLEVNTNDILIPEEIEDGNEGLLHVELRQENSGDNLESDEKKELYSKIEGEDQHGYKLKHPVKCESDSPMDVSTSSRNRLLPRSKNFTPQECSLLLKCVRAEKKYVFNVGTSPAMLMLKNRAWTRVTNAFNRQSQNKRSLDCLRQKFYNMKRLGKKLGFMNKKDAKNETINCKKSTADDFKVVVQDIKIEPTNESENEDDVSRNSGHNNDSFDEDHDRSNPFRTNAYPDPLSVNFHSDSRIGNAESSKYSENNDTSKLKQELLKCQLENAMLEKKRIEDAMRAEASAIEMRATEMAMRLRAARLEAVAAALKLPTQHPALQFTPEEKRAEYYINSCQ